MRSRTYQILLNGHQRLLLICVSEYTVALHLDSITIFACLSFHSKISLITLIAQILIVGYNFCFRQLHNIGRAFATLELKYVVLKMKLIHF